VEVAVVVLAQLAATALPLETKLPLVAPEEQVELELKYQ
jgi:hypothetical protein